MKYFGLVNLLSAIALAMTRELLISKYVLDTELFQIMSLLQCNACLVCIKCCIMNVKVIQQLKIGVCTWQKPKFHYCNISINVIPYKKPL